MPLNSQYIDFLTRFENFRDTAYWDKKGKKWTIGYGTTYWRDGKKEIPVEKGDTITEPKAREQLKAFYEQFMPTIKK